ncbi:Electron transfer flavoprotein alpha subunit-like protein [Candidatus Sulfopaludibacter sp. SbA4]|nr:Electron transfer flavoprotein alpha subunit-like protein [Candidatus Sulfopaludibacter sp. SbA4]
MESILLLAHTESDGTLAKPALEALAAALAMEGELSVGMVGAAVEPAANQIAGCGAARFLGVSGPAFGQSRYSTDAAAAEALCRASGAAIVIAPSTSRWARALPGVAYRLGGRIDTHVTHVTNLAAGDGTPAVTRWFYRQRMEAVLTRSERPWMVLLDAGCVVPWSAPGPSGAAAVESVAVEAPVTRTTVTGIQAPKADEQTIRPDAKLLFVAGAGWTKKQSDGAVHAAEAEGLILGFLRAAKASLGGSKSLVDLSGEGEAVLRCMTHLNQIGQTGATPRHPKGLSTCCHGEEPHVVGWRFVNQRRAINLDANCGWARGKADVLYVADAFEVMRRVNRLLEAG